MFVCFLLLCQPTAPTPSASAPKPWFGMARPAEKPSSGEKLSPAERIVRAERLLEADRKELAESQAQLADPQSEWNQTEAAFKKLDGQLEEARLRKKRWEEREEPAQAQRRATVLKELEASLPKLEADWAAARDRFNAALELKKTLQQKADALTLKIKQDEAALAKLKGEVDRPTLAATKPAPPAPPIADSSKPGPAIPMEATGLQPLPSSPMASKPTTILGNNAKASQELDKAEKEAQAREAALADARDKSHSLNERVDALRRNIELEQKLLAGARQKSDGDLKRQQELEAELRKKQQAGAPAAEIDKLRTELTQVERSFNQARQTTRSSSVRLSQLQEELSNLQAEQIAALQEEARSLRDAEQAKQRVAELKNPFTPHNILQWLLDRGPYILVILVGMWLLHRLVKVSGQGLVALMARHSLRGSQQDRENRARTLVSVFSNAATLMIITGGTIMLLDTLGIPIIPLLGGAAIFGLAIAFGAQNLIKDYFAGFMVLLEDQYSVNDVVKIGNVSGVVESISLRVTVLRDVRGTVHFIPHNTINTVSNMTHGWARAYFEISVSYEQNVDRVMEVLLGLAKELRRDPLYGTLILDEAEMQGVDAFAESAVVIKFFMKTQPLQQWRVQREMLRRIKNRFDELGIEIPYPHRTLVHRHDSPEAEALGRRAA